jgi:hypothetical protein
VGGIATALCRKMEPRRRTGDLGYKFAAYRLLEVRQLADREHECAGSADHAAPTKTVSVTLLRSALMAQKPDAKIAATILSVSFTDRRQPPAA